MTWLADKSAGPTPLAEVLGLLPAADVPEPVGQIIQGLSQSGQEDVRALLRQLPPDADRFLGLLQRLLPAANGA